MTDHNASSDKGAIWISPVTAIFLVAIALFVVNVLPVFSVGYYQDDYKGYLDPVQQWGGNYWQAMQQNGAAHGFRPLLYVFRLFLWNLFGGENIFLHRL